MSSSLNTASATPRRVVSSSSALLESEFSHPVSNDPESPSSTNGDSQINSRRVLADITWWFDGQFCAMEDGTGLDEVDSAALNTLAESVVGLSSSLESAFGTGLSETPAAPEVSTPVVHPHPVPIYAHILISISFQTFTMDYYPPSPTSSTSSTSSKLLTVLEESDAIPWPSISSMPSLKNRREASFSSVSDLDFEDVVPCPAFV